MRWITAGESHGQALSAIIEGMPAHVEITTADIDFHLARRRLGVGRGARQNFEADKFTEHIRIYSLAIGKIRGS